LPTNNYASDNITVGSFDGKIYKNDFLGFSVSLPQGWFALDEKKRMEMMSTGLDLIAGDDKNYRTIVEVSKLKTVIMFSFYKQTVGFTDKYDHNIGGFAESLGLRASSIKRGSDYLFHVKEALKQGKLKYAFHEKYQTKKIGSKTFDILSMAIKVGNMTLRQKLYCTIVKGYSIVITISYENQEQLKELESIIDSIKI